jgi:predicted SnoaL-like aldol condensation-catalyzing enzyme
MKTAVGLIACALVAATATAQQTPPANAANPAPGCTATAAQLEANKKVAMQFFRVQGDERVALADPSYKQHNPAFKKRAEDAKISDFEEFKNSFSSAALAARQGGAGAGAGRGPGAGPQPPAGNPFEIVTAECDLVTVIHRNNRQDPTAAPGKFFEVFTFDTFRIRNGKLVEHWDGAVINPPAPAGGGRQ